MTITTQWLILLWLRGAHSRQLVVAGRPWHTQAQPHNLLPVYVCIQISPLYRDKVMWVRATVLPCDLFLTD